MSWPKPIGSVNCKNKQGKILRTAFKESRLVTRGPSHAPSREAPLLLAIERGFSKRILLLPFALPLPAHELEEKRKEIHCGDTSTAERGLPIPFPSLPFPSLPFPSLPFPSSSLPLLFPFRPKEAKNAETLIAVNCHGLFSSKTTCKDTCHQGYNC